MALALLVVGLAFEGALQLVLNAGVIPSLLTHREKLDVGWTSAWSAWPTRIHLRNFRLDRREGFGWWRLRVDRATVDLDLWELFDKRFVTNHLDVRGIGLRFEAAEPPPRPRAPGERPKQHRDWAFALRGVEVHDLDELVVGWFRFAARLEGGGEFEVTESRNLALRGVRLHFHDGLATSAGGSRGMVDDLVVTTDGGANKVRGQNTGVRLVQGLSGTVDLVAHWDALDWLGGFAADDSTLVRGGAGRMDGALRIVRGALDEGSRLQAHGETVALRAGPLTFSGPYEWEVTVPGNDGPTRLDAQVAPLTVRAAATFAIRPILEAPVLRVGLAAHGRDILDLFHGYDVAFGFAGATLPALRLRDDASDDALGLSAGWFSLDASLHVPIGRGDWASCTVIGRKLAARWGSTPFTGTFSATARLRRLHGEEGGYAGEASARVSHVRIGSGTGEPLSATLALTRVRAHQGGRFVEGQVDGHLSDASPLLALLGDGSGVQARVGAVLQVHSVRLSTVARVTPDTVSLKGLELRAGKVRVRGRTTTRGNASTAVLRLDVWKFTMGVEVGPDGTRTHLLHARDWLRRQEGMPVD